MERNVFGSGHRARCNSRIKSHKAIRHLIFRHVARKGVSAARINPLLFMIPVERKVKAGRGEMSENRVDHVTSLGHFVKISN
jgi:hypothetical protein